jgi:urease accessory protein
VGGDALHLSCRLGPCARALLTTPAATKLYRSAGPTAEQRQTFLVGAGAVLEWLPQETIAYAGALADSHTRVSLAPDAQFCGWEVTCLGQDNRGLPNGRLVQGLQLSRDGRPLWTERAVFEGGSSLLTAAWGLAGRPVVGTFLATGAATRHVDAVRELVGTSADDWLSATLVGEVLVCRYLGYSAEAAKRLLGGAWRVIRPDVSGRQAHPPRVWPT